MPLCLVIVLKFSLIDAFSCIYERAWLYSAATWLSFYFSSVSTIACGVDLLQVYRFHRVFLRMTRFIRGGQMNTQAPLGISVSFSRSHHQHSELITIKLSFGLLTIMVHPVDWLPFWEAFVYKCV